MPGTTPSQDEPSADAVAAALREGQLLVLELIAAGDTRDGVLGTLCHLVERFANGGRALILVASEDGRAASLGAAPSLPESFRAEAPGLLAQLARCLGSGPLVVTLPDVEASLGDPASVAEARRFGIRSLVSIPVRGPDSGALGLFVLTGDHVGEQPTVAVDLMHAYTALVSVAIRNDQRERSLARSQEAIREAQRIGRFGDLTLAVGSTRMTWSEQTYALYGRPVAAGPPTLERFVAAHLPPGREVLERALAGEGPPYVDIEIEVELPAGQRGYHRFLLSRMHADGSVRVTGTVQDVTERRRTESALQQAQRLESLGLLAGGIAHDFNNLLAALLAHVNLMQRRLPAESPARESLAAIDGIVQRATDLTRQILTYAGRSRVRRELVHMDGLVQEITGLLAAAMPKSVRVTLDLRAGDVAIQGDPAQLQQVVMNLVTNAVDAIGEQAGTVSVRTYISVFQAATLHARFPEQEISPGEFIVLEVQDTGVGMAPDTLAKMFDPFFTTKRSGRGLGMSAVRGILNSHGAGVEIESALGEGTLMRVAFPVHGADRLERVSRLSTTPPQASGQLLLAEDEASVRDACAAALADCGYEVVVAEDGAQALERFAADPGRFRAILSDLRMPHLNGHELFDRARALRPDVPFVLCTGYGDSSDLDALVNATRTALLEKPLRIEDLVATIERLARQRAER
ncbi:MAG: response regulator [Myxococcales bacterium]|nr:response regulator [Myxococcales bacterium]